MAHYTREPVDVTAPMTATEFSLSHMLNELTGNPPMTPKKKKMTEVLIGAAYLESPYQSPKLNPSPKGEVKCLTSL